MTWFGSSPKTGEPVSGPMEELVRDGHLELKDILEMIQRMDRVTQCIVCGKKWGKCWVLNPEESDVDHVCQECLIKYDH